MGRAARVSKVRDQVDLWERNRGHIFSNKGAWVIGRGIFNHGYSMLDDLVGKASFFQILVLNVTGRLPEERLAKWLEGTFICLSWPDPRVWCNQIAALGGDSRATPVASVAAACLASDSKLYGPGTVASTVKFFKTAMLALGRGKSVVEFIEDEAKLKGRLLVPGFARPIATGDERVAAMQAYADELGFEEGAYLKMANEIEAYLGSHYGESLNFSGYMCAFLLDQGFRAIEGYRICSLCVNAGALACYSEYGDKTAGSFLPLRCDDIEYIGVREREVPCV